MNKTKEQKEIQLQMQISDSDLEAASGQISLISQNPLLNSLTSCYSRCQN